MSVIRIIIITALLLLPVALGYYVFLYKYGSVLSSTSQPQTEQGVATNSESSNSLSTTKPLASTIQSVMLPTALSVRSPLIPTELANRWVLLFIGYTHCPDVCPTTMDILSKVAKQLPDSVGYLFVSVDPQRDTQQQIDEYISYFSPKLRGTTGSKAEIDKLVEQIRGNYMFKGDRSSDNYLVFHSAALHLLSPEGELVAILRQPHIVNDIVNITKQIISSHNPGSLNSNVIYN